MYICTRRTKMDEDVIFVDPGNYSHFPQAWFSRFPSEGEPLTSAMLNQQVELPIATYSMMDGIRYGRCGD